MRPPGDPSLKTIDVDAGGESAFMTDMDTSLHSTDIPVENSPSASYNEPVEGPPVVCYWRKRRACPTHPRTTRQQVLKEFSTADKFHSGW